MRLPLLLADVRNVLYSQEALLRFACNSDLTTEPVAHQPLGPPGDGLREQNFGLMGTNQHPPEVRRGLVERRASRIANARSVTFGLAVTFFPA